MTNQDNTLIRDFIKKNFPEKGDGITAKRLREYFINNYSQKINVRTLEKYLSQFVEEGYLKKIEVETTKYFGFDKITKYKYKGNDKND